MICSNTGDLFSLSLVYSYLDPSFHRVRSVFVYFTDEFAGQAGESSTMFVPCWE